MVTWCDSCRKDTNRYSGGACRSCASRRAYEVSGRRGTGRAHAARTRAATEAVKRLGVDRACEEADGLVGLLDVLATSTRHRRFSLGEVANKYWADQSADELRDSMEELRSRITPEARSRGAEKAYADKTPDQTARMHYASDWARRQNRIARKRARIAELEAVLAALMGTA